MPSSFVSIPARDLLPHREPLLLVDELIEISENAGVVIARVSKETLALQNRECKELGSHWAIEYIAQAVAALFGYKWRERNCGAAIGFIIAIDHFEALEKCGLSEGANIRIEAKLDYDAFPMGVYDGLLYKDDKLYAKGRLKCFVQANEGLNI